MYTGIAGIKVKLPISMAMYIFCKSLHASDSVIVFLSVQSACHISGHVHAIVLVDIIE